MTTKTTEFRNFTVSPVELREGSDTLTLEGYASVFDKPYDIMGFSETVNRGAFSKTLQEKADVRLLVNHDGLPLARTTSGTLQLSEDERGLMVRAELDPADPDVQSIVPKMRRGDLNEMSFGFRTIKDEWNDDMSKRSLKEVKLFDVSVVTMPANPATTATIRSLDAVVEMFGIQPEQLTALLEMREADKELTSEQMEMLISVRDKLNEVLSESEKSDDDEKNEEDARSFNQRLFVSL